MSQVTAREIAERLAERAEKVARHLLGDEGQRKGHELCYGDLNGCAGKSVSIHLTGAKAGLWGEFNGGESGDLLGLWQAARNCDIYTAIQEAKEYLGIRDVVLTGKKAEAKAIQRPQGIRPLGAGDMYWLREVRKLSAEAIETYKLVSKGTGVIGFPLLLPNNDLVGMKFRKTSEDFYWAETGGAKVLFGWQAVPADARRIVLCEGELKALAWWDYGFPALSMPFGGGDKGKQDWVELDYDRLARFDVIYLAMDADDTGKKAGEAVMARLGPERCAVITLPLPAEPEAKCINACLKHGVSRAAIQKAVLAAKPRDPDELKGAGDYADEVAAMFAVQGPECGIRTPWKKVGDDLVFRAGELTVIAGINGHGKSQAVGFMAAAAMRDGFRVCVASLEFKVAGWLKRLVRQFAGRSDVSERYARAIVTWLGDGALWAFDAQGTTDWKRMLEVFRYARRRYGIELFVIDNLTGLGIGEEDYQGQKALALALANFCRDEECHVWLVHHIRKTNSEHGQPDKMDIKGSGAITDLASTVLTVWRNKAKEAKKKEADMTRQPMDPEEASKPDVRITCSKQRNYTRNGNGEPAIALWWDADAYHYLAKQDHSARSLLPRGWDDEPATQPP